MLIQVRNPTVNRCEGSQKHLQQVQECWRRAALQHSKCDSGSKCECPPAPPQSLSLDKGLVQTTTFTTSAVCTCEFVRMWMNLPLAAFLLALTQSQAEQEGGREEERGEGGSCFLRWMEEASAIIRLRGSNLNVGMILSRTRVRASALRVLSSDRRHLDLSTACHLYHRYLQTNPNLTR